MSDQNGYYKVLGLEPGSSMESVRSAYNKLLIEFHPDYGTRMKKAKQIQNDAEKKKTIEEIHDIVKKINEAKQVLLDKEKKQEYDNPPSEFNIFDMFNFNRKRKVQDTQFEITITMAQAYTGVSKKFKIKRTVLCTECDGKGGEGVEVCGNCNGKGKTQQYIRNGPMVRVHEEICNKCKGARNIVKGKVCMNCSGQRYAVVSETLSVEVAPGVRSGEDVLYEGMGDEHEGCVTGDLKFRIMVEESEYSRVGDDIVAPVSVDLYTALNGGTIQYTHLDDVVYCVKVNKVKSFNDMICVKGLGFNSGNLYLKPEYEIPDVSPTELAKIFNVPRKAEGKAVTGKHSEAPEDEVCEDQNEGFNAFKSFFSF